MSGTYGSDISAQNSEAEGSGIWTWGRVCQPDCSKSATYWVSGPSCMKWGPQKFLRCLGMVSKKWGPQNFLRCLGMVSKSLRKSNSGNGLDKKDCFQIEVVSSLHFYPIPVNSYTMLSTKQRLIPFFLQVVVVVQSQSCVWAHRLQHTRLPCPSLCWSLLKLMSIEFTMPSNRITLSHPLLFLPSIFPSVRVFSKELALCIRRSKH